MQISSVHIRNFRKLKDCSLDLANDTTILVGANNSGKTSAIMAFKKFLSSESKFLTRDFTLYLWKTINERFGRVWESLEDDAEYAPSVNEWIDCLPTFDLWISASEEEAYLLDSLVTSLEANQTLYGLRIRLEPLVEILYHDYREAYRKSKLAREQLGQDVKLFPKNLHDFIEKSDNISKYFKRRYYVLNPDNMYDESGKYVFQIISETHLDSYPLSDILKIDFIDAYREFSEWQGQRDNAIDTLSKQFQEYHKKVYEDKEDIYANQDDVRLQKSLNDAHDAHNQKLQNDLSPLIVSLKEINYPGFNNPSIFIESVTKLADSIHETSIQFEIDGQDEVKLYESFNGLGYRNLLSMCIKLYGFKENRLHPENKGINSEESKISPIHIVFIEEPEAHLHAQAQQVFIRKIYEMMNNTKDGEKEKYKTQLVVSTHSGHIVHEVDMEKIRYFKRTIEDNRKISRIISLTNVFGDDTDGKEQKKFVSRYIKLTHCDIYFADAIILVEGAAEKILLRQFLSQMRNLYRCYVSVIEINGSHAHTLRPLIERLELITLIITDIDAIGEGKDKNDEDCLVACHTQKGKQQQTNNDVLKNWIPNRHLIDDLLDLNDDSKIQKNVRIAYQTGIETVFKNGENPVVAYPYTFEDALVLTNIETFREAHEEKERYAKQGALTTVCNLLSNSDTCEKFLQDIFVRLHTNAITKAQLAVNLLYNEWFENLVCPKYIKEGLLWLESQLAPNTPNEPEEHK